MLNNTSVRGGSWACSFALNASLDFTRHFARCNTGGPGFHTEIGRIGPDRGETLVGGHAERRTSGRHRTPKYPDEGRGVADISG